jgi:hypothetical protein
MGSRGSRVVPEQDISAWSDSRQCTIDALEERMYQLVDKVQGYETTIRLQDRQIKELKSTLHKSVRHSPYII